MNQMKEDKRTHLISILKKQDPSTKHLSSSARRRAAIEFANTNFPDDVKTFGAEGFLNLLTA